MEKRLGKGGNGLGKERIRGEGTGGDREERVGEGRGAGKGESHAFEVCQLKTSGPDPIPNLNPTNQPITLIVFFPFGNYAD